jgi:hypothetical protein
MACSPPDFIVMRQPDRLGRVVTWESVEWEIRPLPLAAALLGPVGAG